MDILWERKYLVSDSFYSAAPRRAGNFPDSSKTKAAPIYLLLSLQTPCCPALPRCPLLLGNRATYRTRGVQFAVVVSALDGRRLLAGPPQPSWPACCSAPHALCFSVSVCVSHRACFAGCQGATAGRCPSPPECTPLSELTKQELSVRSRRAQGAGPVQA